MYHVYYSKKINDKNKGKLLTIFLRILYLHCWKKKFNKTKENKRKTQVREREMQERETERYLERERSGPEAHRSVWSRPKFKERERATDIERDRERERGRERETLL
jgi:hypothetical protein